jgi:hypothetical protein
MTTEAIRPLNSQRHRATREASRLWAEGRYHQAITVLMEAGMTRQERDAFVRAAHTVARERTVRLLS